MVFGVILILIMFVLPGGVASLIRRATAPIVRNLNRPKRPKAGAAVASRRLSVRFEVVATRTLHPDRTRQRELRREELLDAADRIVRAGGRDTSMDEIAAEAGDPRSRSSTATSATRTASTRRWPSAMWRS